MKVHGLRIGIILVGSIALVCTGVFLVRQHRTQEAARSVSALWRNCLPRMQDRSRWMTCWQNALPGIIRKYGLAATLHAVQMQYDDNDYSSDMGITRCHDVSHLIGRVAVLQSKNLAATFRECTSLCGYGCPMGVIDGYLSRGNTLQSDTFVTICDTSSQRYPCVHSVGHTIGNITGSVSKGQMYCLKFPDPVDLQHCMTGLLMERFESPSFGHATDPIPDDLLGYCNTVDERGRPVCYWRMGILAYYRTRDMQKAIRTCDDVPAFERGGCTNVLSEEMYYILKANADDILQFCHMYPDQSVQHQCIEGAVIKSVISDSKGRHAIELCGKLDMPFRSECFSFLGDTVAGGPKQSAERTSVCQTIGGKDGDACMRPVRTGK